MLFIQWDSFGVVKTVCGRNMLWGGQVKVEIIAFLTEYVVYESYINATGCLNSIFKDYYFKLN
jgi:hypothetical protein